MDISTVYMSQEGVCDEQDTEDEYETETGDETNNVMRLNNGSAKIIFVRDVR